jgi:hypothetical protein
MSSQEQDAAVGALVRRRSELRREQAALASKLHLTGNALSELAAIVLGLDPSTRDIEGVTLQVQRYSQIAGANEVLRMAQELVDLNRQLAATESQARVLGVE